MEVNVINFYCKERDDAKRVLVGSLHAFIVDLGIHLRGIMVKKVNNNWFFSLPQGLGVDLKTNKKVRFPIVAFSDQKETANLRKAISQKGKDYIIKNVLCN